MERSGAPYIIDRCVAMKFVPLKSEGNVWVCFCWKKIIF